MKRDRSFIRRMSSFVKKLSFAQEETAVDKSKLERRRAVPHSQAPTRDRLSELMLSIAPGMYALDIRPTRSTSAAHGYLILSNQEYFDLLDDMYESDETLRMCLDLIVSYMLMRPQGIRIDEDDVDDAQADAMIQFFQDKIVDNPNLNFGYMLWSLALGILIHGRSTIEIVWKQEADGAFVPEKFYHCHPGQFIFDRDGTMLYADTQQAVEPLKFVSAANHALYDNPFGRSELFPFRYKWQYKKRVLVAKLQYLERFGTPIVHGSIPDSVNEKAEVMQAFMEAIEGLQDGMAIVTAQGEEIEVHQRASSGLGGSDGVHDAILDRFDSYFIKALLGAELTTTIKNKGARSLGEVQERTVLNKILPFAKIVCSALNLSLFDPVRKLNFGETAPVVRYWMDTEESTDAEDARATLECAVKNGVETTLRQAQEMLGIEPRIGDEPVLKRAASVIDRVLSQQPGTQQNVDDSDAERVELPEEDDVEDDELAATAVTRRRLSKERKQEFNEAMLGAGERSRREKETKFAESYSYGCAMLNLSDFARLMVADFITNEIDEDDLHTDADGNLGVELDSHVTVLYGLLPSVTREDVEKAVAGEFWQWVWIEGFEVFELEDCDVLVMRVETNKELLALREALMTLPHELTRPEFKPHVTVAYLKKGTAQKYLDRYAPLEDCLEVVDWLTFSTADNETSKIALTGPYVEMTKDSLRDAQRFVKQVESSAPIDSSELMIRRDEAGIKYRAVRMNVNKEAEKLGRKWEQDITAAALEDTRSQLVTVWKDTVERLRKYGDQKVASVMKRDVDVSALQVEETARRIVLSMFMIRQFIARQQLEGINKTPPRFAEQAAAFADDDLLDKLPEGFKDAADWMASRGVMTIERIRELAKIMAEQFGDDAAKYERELRDHYLSLTKVAETGATKKIQNSIEQAVKNGLTLQDFLSDIENLVSNGDLPPGLESYWETVFRTEVGNAYKQAQIMNESDPDFEPYHWGWEGFNPNDDRSDPTHAAIDGEYFKKGSAASRALGLPPFRYNCRCSLFALTTPEPGTDPYKESSDALFVAARVTHF